MWKRWRFWRQADKRPPADIGSERRLGNQGLGRQWKSTSKPENGSVGAFLKWMAEQIIVSDSDGREWAWKLPREWRQSELYDAYQEACQWIGKTPVGKKRFARETKEAGCRRWQGDIVNEEGVRERPVMIAVPEAGEVKIPVPLRASKRPPFPKLPKGPGIGIGTVRSVSKVNGAASITIGRAA